MTDESKESFEFVQNIEDESEIREPDEHEDDDISLETLDDDFNHIITSIVTNEEAAMDFQLPEKYNIQEVIDHIKINKEVTERHKLINEIISRIDVEKLFLFVKKLFFKFSKFISRLETDPKEKDIAQFYTLVHSYSTGDEYAMQCLILFEHESSFSDCHKCICYDILESVRIFFIQQKVDLLKITGANIPKRYQTNASKARIRYVGGYCLSTLRKKYIGIRNSNIYSKTFEGQCSYDTAKCALKIISALREEENFLKKNTSDPESLADIDRRGYSSGRLINVTDSFFLFMQKLTNYILSVLIYENLMKYGKDLMSHCFKKITENNELYEEFVNGTISAFRSNYVQEFSESGNITCLLENMSLVSAMIFELYVQIVKKYIVVLLAQFRRDFKSHLNVEKTMAHRKQIKVSKTSTTKNKTDSSETEPKRKKRKRKSNHAGPAAEPKQGPSNVPQPVPSTEPQPGPSTEPLSTESQPDQSVGSPSDDNDSELCQKCFSDQDGDWIQCDSCDRWFHRQCAGIRTKKQYKKVSAAVWFCKECV